MSIVPLSKVTLYGPAAEKNAVLDGLQSLGCLHLNDLRPSAAEGVEREPSHPDARQALQYLRDSPVRRRAPRQRENVDIEAVVKEVLDVRDRSRSLAEEREQLRKWIADLEPWGDFELPEWAHEGALRFWFYMVPHHQMRRLEAITLPWRVVGRDHRFVYVVVVAADQPAGMPVPPVPLEPRSLSKVRGRLEQVERELEELDYRRIGLTYYRDLIRVTLDEADDRAARQQAALRAYDQDQVFAVQGWAPSARVSALRQFAADRRLALTIEAPGPQDAPPTLLDNPPALRGGEGLVTFYKTPAYRLWDPSKAVFFAFAVFFAMIFSDAGYGLLLGVILLATWKRLGRTDTGRGLREVMLALVIFSILYGVLVGTYFGVTPPAGSWLASLHVLDASDQRLMMWIAIGVGAAHLTYANLVTAWRRRHSPTALSALGWAAIIQGGFCVGLGHSYPELASLTGVGWGGLALGGLLVLLLTSERPFGLAPRQLFGRLVDGLKGATELSKAFGDVLSYLRLFALGLASIKLAEAFNDLAATSFAFKGVGVLLGLLILLVGHGINFAMGIMSGVVHGLRLNLIEFFNWSLPEEGQRFEAFAKKASSGIRRPSMEAYIISLLGWIGIYSPVALAAVGSAIGCTRAGKAACGAILEVDGGYGRYIGLSVLPSSIVIYGIVIMFTLNRPVVPATSPGLFGVGVLVGVAMLFIGILQGECCAAAINASKGKPAIFGISVTPAAIVEGFAVFAFVFALIVSGAIPKG